MAFSTCVDLLTDGWFQQSRLEFEKERPLVKDGAYLCLHVRCSAVRPDEESKLNWT